MVSVYVQLTEAVRVGRMNELYYIARMLGFTNTEIAKMERTATRDLLSACRGANFARISGYRGSRNASSETPGSASTWRCRSVNWASKVCTIFPSCTSWCRSARLNRRLLRAWEKETERLIDAETSE